MNYENILEIVRQSPNAEFAKRAIQFLDGAAGCEVIDGCLVAPAGIYCVGDAECSDIVYADSANEAAREWLDSDPIEGISTVRAYRPAVDAYGHADCDIERVDLEIFVNPTEPECSGADGHNWTAPHELVGGLKENPGVGGHGAGLRIHEVCSHCGCGRVTDTYHQNSCTGKIHEKIEYTPGQYAEDILPHEVVECSASIENIGCETIREAVAWILTGAEIGPRPKMSCLSDDQWSRLADVELLDLSTAEGRADFAEMAESNAEESLVKFVLSRVELATA